MRKFLSNGAMIFAGMVSVPAIVTSVDAKLPQSPNIPAGTFKTDPRLPLLQKFFGSMDAPAKDYSHIFLTEADLYDLDWRLLPSISFVETTGGKAARNNNLFGWDCGRAEFTSMTDGIRTVAYNLGNSERYKDKDLDEVLLVYNPNPEYSRIVKSVMSRIAPAE
jgi:hypothetical protein